MCHKSTLGIVGLLAALLAPGTVRAQVLALPVAGWSSPAPYGLYGPSYYAPGLPYGLGYRAAFYGYGAGANPYAAGAALYNPLRYNAAFAPTPYNPTPQVYNPLLYNAAFNPALAQANQQAYAAKAGAQAKAGQTAAGQPADKSIRPAAFDTAAKQPARIRMTLPAADATVTLQGVAMKLTGTDRLFVTPPLEQNSKYSYDVVVRWRAGGGEQSLTRHVRILAGQDLNLDFTGKRNP
jgi:uncharacterized protein (TIGR03000 family)